MYRQRAAAVCCAALAALAIVLPARANIGPRWWGDVTTEPWGLKEVAIAYEQLTIDLRPLADGQPAQVDVTYHLDNGGAPRKLDLLFVSGEMGVSEFEARLGERLLDSRPLSRSELHRHWDRFPKAWKPPERPPGIEWAETYPHYRYWETDSVPVAFSAELPAGPSKLSVRYRARATGTDESHPTVTWQFPYVLAPAREWGSFGRLDVTAYLPEDWEARSTPALEREGGAMRGSFTGLPADALLLAVRAPVPPDLERTTSTYLALCGLTLLAGGILCWLVARRLGRFLGRRDITPPGRSLAFGLCVAPFAVGLPLLWVAMILGAEGLAAWRMVAAFRGQESPYFTDPFHAFYCWDLILIPPVLLIGVAITLQTVSRAARTLSGGKSEMRPVSLPGGATTPDPAGDSV